MTHRILSIALVCCSFSVLSQKSKVVLSASKTTIEVGETITLKVETNVAGDYQIDNLPSAFQYGGGVGYGSFEEMDYNTGNVFRIHVHSQNGAFSKPGTYTIGPAYVRNRAGDAVQSNKITIKVEKKVQLSNGQISAQQRSDPAFGVIQTSKNTIYEGEAIVVGAKIYSRFQPSRIGNYSTFVAGKGIEFQSLTSSSTNLRLRDENLKGDHYFTFEYDRNLVFPSGTGLFTFDPFTMDVLQGFNGFTVTSNSATIKIKPLPNGAPKDFIGAVGKFSIFRSIDTSRVKQGDVLKMIVVIEGTGNIQNTLEPELNLPKGMIVYGDPVVTPHITYGVNGGEGKITYEFNIQVSNPGKVTIPATSISYFDPVSANYVTVKSSESSLVVMKDNNLVAADTKKLETNEAIYTQSATDLRLKKEVRSTTSIFGTPLFWTGVGAPLLCAFFFVFFVRRREQSADEIESKQAIQQKDKELHELVHSAKIKLQESSTNDEFYSIIEHALRKAFECKMGITDRERILSKQEIFDHLSSSNDEQLLLAVRNLFQTCEESRFGFGLSSDLRQPAFDQLETILKAMKQ